MSPGHGTAQNLLITLHRVEMFFTYQESRETQKPQDQEDSRNSQ